MVSKLRSGIHILGRHFPYSESFGGKLRGRHFSGLEGAWLCLMNSGAALESWGAIFTWLGAQRVAFSRLRGRPIVVAELRGGIHILGHGFQVQSHWLGSSEGGIFSGLEGARLCLRNSMAAFVSWGAPVSSGWELKGRHVSGLEGARMWLWISGAAFASWGAVFRFRSLVGKLRGRHFSGLEGTW